MYSGINENSIEKILCHTALNKLKRKIPYGWDLNIYRGCKHGCRYCYAIYSHQYLKEEDFSRVFVKTNIVEQLERELSDPGWNREVINIGGVTDSYQEAEAEMKIMPEVLKVLIRYKTPAIISTKSSLILRDYDLIAELAGITYVNIAATITTMDENIRCLIEPHGSSSSDRFRILKEFRKTNASVGLHTMPVIPFLTDSYANLEHICAEARNSDVHYMLPGVLYLRGATRKVFMDFYRNYFPEKYENFASLYKTGGADKGYKEKLYSEIINPLRKKYGLSGSYTLPMKAKMHKN